jgi:hypothetical protein
LPICHPVCAVRTAVLISAMLGALIADASRGARASPGCALWNKFGVREYRKGEGEGRSFGGDDYFVNGDTLIITAPKDIDVTLKISPSRYNADVKSQRGGTITYVIRNDDIPPWNYSIGWQVANNSEKKVDVVLACVPSRPSPQ